MQNFDGEIKIKSWIKKIKINDKGDFISLNLADSDFVLSLIKFVEASQDELKRLESEIKDKDPLEKIKINSEFNKNFSRRTDEILGENTCFKVFNTNTPFSNDIMEFLEQLTEILEPYISERQNHMKNIEKKYIEKSNNRRDRI